MGAWKFGICLPSRSGSYSPRSLTTPTGVVAVAPDGSWLVADTDYSTLQIWDMATRRERVTLTDHAGMIKAVAIAPDGSWLAAAGGKTVQIWDVATGQLRVTLSGHAGEVETLAIAPDGSWLATGGNDGTVRIWDVAAGHERAILTGHTGIVETVALTPDGKWLASGGSDQTIRIWDVTTTRRVRALMRIDNSINCCTWLEANGLVVGGPAGLYLFDFLPGPSRLQLHTDTGR
jgi:WD40 repeat protein